MIALIITTSIPGAMHLSVSLAAEACSSKHCISTVLCTVQLLDASIGKYQRNKNRSAKRVAQAGIEAAS